ncbi:polymorphic toxin-type HINT domain-containing protein, partial [Streptomyces sp. NPDC029080]|uniref:polymorphic toxin-type HINT domain-containing protein n=1 Tax=Streptomyces sp. NPDC029080 TaxID=3155017 RepID=UPI0033D09921
AAMTQKAAADTFTVDLSQSVVEGQAIVDDTKALSEEADKPDVDEAALAVKGRAVALRALKYFGSWRQDAAVQALSGTDADVLAYLRTGWDQAVTAETRQQVADLVSDSPYEAVRTAAAAALDGTDEQIRDFYTTGQHQAANADYRVAVTKLANDGGPGVKENAKAALADGSTTALLDFLNKGQYAAQQADERVTATQLYDDGGPEVRSAAKIALAGSPDEVHQFVQSGQYMAAQQDGLADTHVAQMQRLLAEGQVIAATARKNSALAAQAAAEAKNASDQADLAKKDAEHSAEQAQGYAAEADAAADRAETSAKQAKASAVTARAAADRAAQDAAAAGESAAQAEFSADYARSSAAEAADARDQAKADALAAGKSADQAAKESAAAWTDVVEKREAEEAEARRLAAEKRKKEEESKPKCYIPVNRDSLPPCAMAGQELVFPTIDPQMKEFAWEILGLNDARDCIKNPTLGKCALAAMSVLPLGKLKLVKKAVEGVEGAIDSSRAVRLAQKCAECFLAGTKVLMADRSVMDIESVRVGDEVLATDPVTGETGARRVTDLIVTEDDKYFAELTISTPSGEQKLTATEEHPFWSPSAGRWVQAYALEPGMTLRTDDGDTVTVHASRFFLKHARTYNLTVEGLHSYYVLAGGTPVLVHNSRCLIGDIVGPQGEKLWLPKGRKAIATANNLKGWIYDIKPSEVAANGFHKTVKYVRVMDPGTSGGRFYKNGYISYINDAGQIINPFSGQTLTKADPYWHIEIP